MRCLKTLLEEAGSKLEDVCKIVIYVTDRAYREAVYRVAAGGALVFAGLLAVSLAGGANGGSTLTRSRANAVAMRW